MLYFYFIFSSVVLSVHLQEQGTSSGCLLINSLGLWSYSPECSWIFHTDLAVLCPFFLLFEFLNLELLVIVINHYYCFDHFIDCQMIWNSMLFLNLPCYHFHVILLKVLYQHRFVELYWSLNLFKESCHQSRPLCCWEYFIY